MLHYRVPQCVAGLLCARVCDCEELLGRWRVPSRALLNTMSVWLNWECEFLLSPPHSCHSAHHTHSLQGGTGMRTERADLVWIHHSTAFSFLLSQTFCLSFILHFPAESPHYWYETLRYRAKEVLSVTFLYRLLLKRTCDAAAMQTAIHLTRSITLSGRGKARKLVHVVPAALCSSRTVNQCVISPLIKVITTESETYRLTLCYNSHDHTPICFNGTFWTLL